MLVEIYGNYPWLMLSDSDRLGSESQRLLVSQGRGNCIYLYTLAFWVKAGSLFYLYLVTIELLRIVTNAAFPLHCFRYADTVLLLCARRV